MDIRLRVTADDRPSALIRGRLPLRILAWVSIKISKYRERLRGKRDVVPDRVVASDVMERTWEYAGYHPIPSVRSVWCGCDTVCYCNS